MATPTKELDSDIFTPYIRKEIISNFNYTSTDIFTITIHIRRGDVNPHKHADRYLYNKYYRHLNVPTKSKRFLFI